jgi:hypothetical protein
MQQIATTKAGIKNVNIGQVNPVGRKIFSILNLVNEIFSTLRTVRQ